VSPPRSRGGRPDGCTAEPEGGPCGTDLRQERRAGLSKRGTVGKGDFVPSGEKHREACLTPCAA
jgi:hypothetical protein